MTKGRNGDVWGTAVGSCQRLREDSLASTSPQERVQVAGLQSAPFWPLGAMKLVRPGEDSHASQEREFACNEYSQSVVLQLHLRDVSPRGWLELA